MRACVCTELSDDLGGVVVADLPDPVPGEAEVLVRIKGCALNFPDVLMTQGNYQLKPALPFVPGMEVAGEIAALGPGVGGWRVGDAVVAGVRTGGLAQMARTPADGLRKKPHALGFDQACAYTTAYLTAYVGLVRRGALKPGETVLVHGAAGGVGLAAVDLARHLGARVIATASSEEKRALARAKGADHVLPSGGFRDQVKTLTQGRGADIVFDPVGGDAFDESVRCIAWGGRLLVIGFASGRIPQISVNLPLIKGFSIVGVRAGEYGRRDPDLGRENLAIVDGLAGAGHIHPHIGAILPLERAVEGLALLKDRKAMGKIVIAIA